MSKKKEGSVERSIYYYDVSVENVEGNSLVNVKEPEKILTEAFEWIKENNEKLEKEKSKKRKEILKSLEFTVESGDKLYIYVDDIDKKNGIIKYRLILCRTDAFPYIEQDGKLTNLTQLVDGDFNIAEITHCILYTKELILGSEFNFNGARPSSISLYLPNITKKVDRVVCTGKIREDVFERITEDRGFSLFQIGVKNTERMRRALRDNMGLLGAFFNTIDNIDTYEISIKRRISKNKEGFLAPVGIEMMNELVRENRDDLKMFRVSQGTRSDIIDLLSDKLVCKRQFILTENKTINSSEVYAAINNYYYAVVKALQ